MQTKLARREGVAKCRSSSCRNLTRKIYGKVSYDDVHDSDKLGLETMYDDYLADQDN